MSTQPSITPRPTSAHPSNAVRLLVATLFTLLVATPMAMLAGSPSATAAGSDASVTGSATWGLKKSFRDYISGPIGHGKITLGDGATHNSSGEFVFPARSGSITGKVANVTFGGAVRFSGHEGQLDLTLSKPKVSIAENGTGYIEVGFTPKGKATKQIRMAALTGAKVTTNGNHATVNVADVKLTKEGVEVFSYKGSGFYPAGTALDPLSMDLTLKSTPTTPTPTTATPTTTSTTAPPTSTSTTGAPTTTATDTETSTGPPVVTDGPQGGSNSNDAVIAGGVAAAGIALLSVWAIRRRLTD